MALQHLQTVILTVLATGAGYCTWTIARENDEFEAPVFMALITVGLTLAALGVIDLG